MDQIKKKGSRSIQDPETKKAKSTDSLKTFFKKIKQDKQTKLNKLESKRKIVDPQASQDKQKLLEKIKEENQPQSDLDYDFFLEAEKTEKDITKKTVKLSLGSINQTETKKIVKHHKLNDEKNANELVDKKQKTKKLLTSFINPSPDCTHDDIFAYPANDGDYVSSCAKCSRLKKWAPHEWIKYNIIKQGKPINYV